jgi:chorismate synthase
MLRFLTAGESHGQALVVIVEGLPAGLAIDAEVIGRDLGRRQRGFGRGQRMRIESDRAEILSGVRAGATLGSPMALLILNNDWKNWQRTMHVDAEPDAGAVGANRPPVTRPRPGHADLAGGVKYERRDLRDVLERASARETAARVAAGAVARCLLAKVGIEVTSHVRRIGAVAISEDRVVTLDEIRALPEDSPLRCVDPEVQARMVTAIEEAKRAGDTLGGSFEVLASHVPPGLGSHVHWDRKLDGRLAQALMSIHAIKGVGLGLGERVAELPGSQAHDEIVLPEDGRTSRDLPLGRLTNRAGGLEGGVTNGEDIRVTAHMKPIATLMRPLRSVDLATMVESRATVERSDVCAVQAAAVIGEAMVCLVLADALLEKYGGDSVGELLDHVAATRARVAAYFPERPSSTAGDEPRR